MSPKILTSPVENAQVGDAAVTKILPSRTVARAHSRFPMIERPDPWLESLLDVALVQIVQPDGTVTRSPYMVRDYMMWVAKRAYDKGRESARMEILTSEEVADQLGVDRTTVWRRAQARGVGWKTGRDVLFWPEDVRRVG